MGWILRTSEDQNNPTLSGGVYGLYITIGKAVYYRFDGTQTRFIIFIADGGKYGLDEVSSVEYKGSPLTPNTNWVFHRGTIPKQISAYTVTLDMGANKILHAANPYVNGDVLRARSVDGNLPSPLTDTLEGQSQLVWVVNRDAAGYQLSSTNPSSSTTLISFTDAGSGTLKVWNAFDTGFDDLEQGLPTFCPEVRTTFNNIAYIEGKLPAAQSSASEQPSWGEFRIMGVGRRLMDYSNTGAELGVLSDNLSNAGLIVLDNLLWNYKIKPSRIDFASWHALRVDADVQILQRVNPNDDAGTDTGFTARYFQGTNGHPSAGAYEQLVISRQDATINIPDTLGNIAPAPGVDPTGFSIIWTANIKAAFTQLYTFRVNHDDGVQLYINGNLIINQAALGNHSATFSMVAGQDYALELRYTQNYAVGSGNHYYCQLYWSAPSLPEQIVPAAAASPSDEVVSRYQIHAAFNQATEAQEVHERFMERVPGWDWTDTGEKIVFLPPNREPVFTFRLDLMDDDSIANFVNKSFKKTRRPLSDRKNFALYKFRYVLQTGYPYKYVQADRENLRRFGNGEPTNDPASDLGVMTRSLAERIAEMEMVLKSDPKHTARLDGGLASSVLRKNQKVLVQYYDKDNNFVADEEYLVTLNSFGSSNNRHAFSLLPLSRNFYFDEPVQ